MSDEKSPHLEEKEKQDEGQASSIPRVISHKSGQAKPDEPTPLNASSLASLKEQQQHQEEKQKTSQHDQSVRLVSLPSLTAPKSPTEVHIDSRESQAKKSQNPPPSHMLSVQVEDSMDEPISYPPTAVMPTHSASEPEINYKSPSKSAGTVTFGPTITTPANPTTPANAKKILKRGGSGGEISSPPQQSGTPKRLSMPTWLSPNTSIDLGGSTSPHSRSKDGAALRHVQEKLEEVTLQKDATERYLRLEIESLKSRLDAAQNLPIDSNQPNMINLPNTTTSTSIPTSSSSSSANTIPVNSHDIEELKLKILSLQQENQNLKEEAMIERIKHQRELTQLKEKHQADLDLGNISKVEEITLLEKRHRDTIEALKKIHLDELNAIKQRAKDGVALDQLSNQIATTTGSLKLIEEQMNLKYRGIDAIREGQYEARERLLIEMEHKAIERAEAAEAEGYKLKGLLSHMEQVAYYSYSFDNYCTVPSS